tara:strand:+ start:2329 stop:3189 length:861 start_codon:yes stop_codon:yes gene_type:complete
MNNWTYGFEVEWGDINRSLPIPDHLGKWEYAETDIVNLNEPYKYIACDPLGQEPPAGGEINMKPTTTWKEQVDKIFELYEFFKSNGDNPTASCVNHGHVHIHIPDLVKDIEKLKKVMRYIQTNQDIVIKACYKFQPKPIMTSLPNCTSYLKLDGGRRMPEYMSNNIINLSNNFNDFIKHHYTGKDGVSTGRPFRYAINTYCLKHTQTIEFRCFRSSIKRKQIEDQFKFVEQFMTNALGDQKPIWKTLRDYEYDFPDFNFDTKEYKGWVNTKYDKSRGEKKREYVAI